MSGVRRPAGADGRTRTPDLLITNQLLYLLSYISACGQFSVMPRIATKMFLAPRAGLEPATLRLTAACSTY